MDRARYDRSAILLLRHRAHAVTPERTRPHQKSVKFYRLLVITSRLRHLNVRFTACRPEWIALATTVAQSYC
eukprot:7552949-Pyramimonas_sp.AAC.1